MRLFPLLLILVMARSATAVDQPNILFIVADDLGWSDVGWHKGFSHTPVMDKLIASGVELDRHYVQPVCTPTRAALLSGRYPGRFGAHVL
jgi:arylsulfatase A-like enzyme